MIQVFLMCWGVTSLVSRISAWSRWLHQRTHSNTASKTGKRFHQAVRNVMCAWFQSAWSLGFSFKPPESTGRFKRDSCYLDCCGCEHTSLKSATVSLRLQVCTHTCTFRHSNKVSIKCWKKKTQNSKDTIFLCTNTTVAVYKSNGAQQSKQS